MRLARGSRNPAPVACRVLQYMSPRLQLPETHKPAVMAIGLPLSVPA